MYYLLYVLFLISLLNLPLGFSLYFSLVLITFSLTLLIFYKKPDYLNSRTIETMRKAILIYTIFALLCFVFRQRISIFLISLGGLIPYLYLGFKERKSYKPGAGKQNKRRALRIDLCLDVELSSLNKAIFYRGVIKDISTAGMRLFLPQHLEKKEEFYFRIYIPEETWPLTGKAEIVWQKPVPDGFEYGMVFTQISEQDRGKIALKQGFSLLK